MIRAGRARFLPLVEVGTVSLIWPIVFLSSLEDSRYGLASRLPALSLSSVGRRPSWNSPLLQLPRLSRTHYYGHHAHGGAGLACGQQTLLCIPTWFWPSGPSRLRWTCHNRACCMQLFGATLHASSLWPFGMAKATFALVHAHALVHAWCVLPPRHLTMARDSSVQRLLLEGTPCAPPPGPRRCPLQKAFLLRKDKIERGSKTRM